MDVYAIDWRLAAIVVVAVVVALVLAPPSVAFALIEVMIFALYASALNLLLSYSGMVSFGHAVYFGLGAYALAITVAKFDWPIAAGIVAGPIVSALFGLMYGALCVQLTAIYAAMLTLACAEVTFAVVFQWFDFTGGDSGISGHVTAMLGLEPYQFGLIVLAVVTVSILMLWRVVHSPLGLTIRAVGQNPNRAAALGHGRKRVQLIAFTISAFFSGIAGTLFGLFHGNVFPDYVGILFTVDGLLMVVLGGALQFCRRYLRRHRLQDPGQPGGPLFRVLAVGDRDRHRSRGACLADRDRRLRPALYGTVGSVGGNVDLDPASGPRGSGIA